MIRKNSAAVLADTKHPYLSESRDRVPGRKIDAKDIRRFQERASYVASKWGHPELADDLAQEVLISFIEKPDRGATVDQICIDYLRKAYGRSGTPGGSARQLAAARTVSLDAPVGSESDDLCFHDVIGAPDRDSELSVRDGECSFLFGGRESFIYVRYFVDQASEATIGDDLGITESRICQILGRMKDRIREYFISREFRERMEWDERFGELAVEWVRF